MVEPSYPQYYFYGKTGTGGDAGKFKDEGGFKNAKIDIML